MRFSSASLDQRSASRARFLCSSSLTSALSPSNSFICCVKPSTFWEASCCFAFFLSLQNFNSQLLTLPFGELCVQEGDVVHCSAPEPLLCSFISLDLLWSPPLPPWQLALRGYLGCR